MLISHKRLQFDLEYELVDHVVAFDGGFGHFLECVEGVGGLVEGLVDGAEFALAELTAEVEVA